MKLKHRYFGLPKLSVFFVYNGVEEKQMRDDLLNFCEDFIVYRDRIDEVYGMFKNYREASVGAFLFMARNQEPNEEMISLCHTILKQKTSIFSNFRGYIEISYICSMAMSDDPERLLNLALAAYDALKRNFSSSPYLSVLAMFMANEIPADQFYDLSERSREIYLRLNKYHRILTDSNDICNCGLLAASGMDIDEIVFETEAAYDYLSHQFFMYKDALHNISEVLVLCYGNWKNKCDRLIGLYNMLLEKDIKFPRSMEFVCLAILANSGMGNEELVRDFMTVDDFLLRQKGYGIFGRSKAERYSHVVMILAAYTMSANHELILAVVTAVLNQMIQEQAAASAAAAA